MPRPILFPARGPGSVQGARGVIPSILYAQAPLGAGSGRARFEKFSITLGADAVENLQGGTYNYWVYIPAAAAVAAAGLSKNRLYLQIAGSGEAGSNDEQMTAGGGMPQVLGFGDGSTTMNPSQTWPTYFIFPQKPSAVNKFDGSAGGSTFGETFRIIDRVMEDCKTRYDADTTKSVFVGYSLGAFIGYDYLYRTQNQFATAVMAAGTVTTSLATVIGVTLNPNTQDEAIRRVIPRIKNTNLFLFNSDGDTTVPPSQYNPLLTAIAAEHNATYTPVQYSGLDHGSTWTTAFLDAGNTLWPAVLNQSLNYVANFPIATSAWITPPLIAPPAISVVSVTTSGHLAPVAATNPITIPATTAGNALVVVYASSDPANNVTSVVAGAASFPSPSLSNSTRDAEIHIATNIPGGITTVTVNTNAIGTGSGGIIVYEVSIDPACTVVSPTANTNASSTTDSIAAVTPTSGRDAIIFAAFRLGGVQSSGPDNSFIGISAAGVTSGGTSASWGAYLIVSPASGSYTTTITAALGRWDAAGVALVAPSGSGQTGNPSPATSSWVVPTVGVSLGDVTASPTVAINSWVVPTVGVSLGNVNASPVVATSSWVVPTPAVTVGGITASPLVATHSWVVPAAVATMALTVAPAVATHSWTALSPAVALAVTALPLPATSSWVVPTPAVSVGGVTASPLVATHSWVAPTPVATMALTVAPAVATSSWVVPTPAVSLASTVTPAPSINTWTALAPTVTLGGITGSPLVATHSWTSTSTTSAQGGITGSPAVGTSAWVVPAPNIQSGGSVTPQPAMHSWVVPAVAVTLGGVTAAPQASTDSWVMPAAVVTTGNVTVSPAVSTHTWVALSPAVALDVTVVPTVATRAWVALTPSLLAGNDVTPLPGTRLWSALSPSVSLGDALASPLAATRGWLVPLAGFSDQSNPIAVTPQSARHAWTLPAAMFVSPIIFTSQDIMQQVAEAIVGVLDTDQDVVAITGRSSINCVPFEDTTFNVLPIMDYFIVTGEQVGGLGDTREVVVDIRASAESGSVCNSLLRLAEQKLIAPRFAALGLDACQLRTKRRDVDVDPDAEQDVKTKLLELTLLVTI